MNKNNKLSELPMEEIIRQKNLLKGVLIGFSVVLAVAYSILIYLMVTNKNYILFTIIPLGFITLLPAILRLKQINTEIKLRNGNIGNLKK